MKEKFKRGLVLDPATGARILVHRKDYEHEDKLTTRILLG